MEDTPYDFIDPYEPEKRKAKKKMEEMSEENRLFGTDGTKRTFDPTEELNPEDWPETRNRVFHHEEDQEETVGFLTKISNIVKRIFR